jgi:RHS repeat-associated protein
VRYTYDASGNRLSQTVKVGTQGTETTTVYIRDGSGGVISVYTVTSALKAISPTKPSLGYRTIWTIQQDEVSLNGSSRLGLRKFGQSERTIKIGDVEAADPCSIVRIDEFGNPTPSQPCPDAEWRLTVTRGNKFFELSNHLGNVLSVVSDFKTWTTEGGIGFYEAQVKAATDYYPFGQPITGRKFNDNAYRYGYNGKENDATWGSELVQDFGARIYAPSFGRFLSTDPLEKDIPSLSPYSYAANNPIYYMDEDGEVPTPSELLKTIGIELNPYVAGFIDGIVANSPAGLVGFAWDFATDKNFRGQMKEGLIAFATSPMASMKKALGEKFDAYAAAFNGTASDKQKYGIGGDLAGLVVGGSIVKILKDLLKPDAGDVKKITNQIDDAAHKKKLKDECKCFTEATLVLTSKGMIPIKNVAVGDTVLAYDDATGETAPKIVLRTFVSEEDTIYHLRFKNSDVDIETTSDHPFFIGGRWLNVQYLRVGDFVTLYSGEKIAIASISFELKNTKVYNFEVDNFHTYFVSPLRVLAHNCKTDPKPDKGEYRDAGGHHVHAQGGFQNHAVYNHRTGFSISQEFMDANKWNHSAMTTKQNQLFRELRDSGRPNTLAEHTRIALESLKAGNVPLKEAKALVKESMENLKKQGVTAPSHIPVPGRPKKK